MDTPLFVPAPSEFKELDGEKRYILRLCRGVRKPR